ncbi:hypothetical protein WH240_09030 [Gluconobacter wancherniae]|uniref:hypothetical protein n=1 Tax=Gluconobacter wancherniae TaxID=1307955 RepID=UPI0030991AAD
MSTDKESGSKALHVTEKAQAAQSKRQELEAKALRANLLRRKQQQRARPVEAPASSNDA